MEIYSLLTGAATGFYYFFAGMVLSVSVLNFVDLVKGRHGSDDIPKVLWAIVIALALIALKV